MDTLVLSVSAGVVGTGLRRIERTASHCGSGGKGAERVDDLVGLGKPLFLLLREHEGPIGGHVELAAGADHQVDVDAEYLLDGGRQTGGLGQVVSNLAVADRHLHGRIVPQHRETRKRA